MKHNVIKVFQVFFQVSDISLIKPNSYLNFPKTIKSQKCTEWAAALLTLKERDLNADDFPRPLGVQVWFLF